MQDNFENIEDFADIVDNARFFGRHEHTIDAKNRVALPSKIRENMTGTIFLVGSIFAPCIALYPADEWVKFEKELDKLSMTNRIKVKRKIYSRLTKITCDSHGRIVIPQNLCEHAHLQRDIMIVGTGDFAEIWDKELWEKENSKDDDSELVDMIHGDEHF